MDVGTPGDQQDGKCQISRQAGRDERRARLPSKCVYIRFLFQQRLRNRKVAGQTGSVEGETVVPSIALRGYAGF
jgi:hypothetical protein